MTDRSPIALELGQFLNLPIENRPPLLGVEGQAAIAAGGLTLLAGKAGLGKTTLIVDAIFHLASGRDWLNFTTGRPLNILVIENEGPLQMFQEKLAAKVKVWPHDLQAQIHVQTGAWGWFSFADLELHTQLGAYLDEHQIDLVVGDPIGTLGMEGVGSPEDTRNFVKLLVPLGLLTNRAFLFPAHFTKEPRKDEIDQISGAWGGHLDTLMVLKSTGRKDELRLSFPKLRWWNAAPPAPVILGKVYNTQSFEILRHEGDAETPLEDRIVALLDDGVWRTVKEICPRDGGVGAREKDVKDTLTARDDLFHWHSGADHGKSARAIVWQLLPQAGSSTTHETKAQSQTELLPASREQSEQNDHLDRDYNSARRPGSSRSSSENGDVAAERATAPAPAPVGERGAVAQQPPDELLPNHGSTSFTNDDLGAIFSGDSDEPAAATPSKKGAE